MQLYKSKFALTEREFLTKIKLADSTFCPAT
jgi:hypothetical protein